MSKLSPALKALVNAPFARPGPCAASARIREVFQSIAGEAKQKRLGTRPWVAFSAAASFTLNSPDTLAILHEVATKDQKQQQQHNDSNEAGAATVTAELIREVGLKCISFNGIPRSINCLNAFYASLPADVASSLCKTPSRQPTTANLAQRQANGRALWDSVYRPFEQKLYDKLAQSHPDLPVHILTGHYALLLSNPSPTSELSEGQRLAGVGRVLTSLVAVACLRAQSGVGPQVLSHVFGLRKALEDGTYKAEGEQEGEDAVRWLASDEGSEWILRSVDRIVGELGGANFAPGGGAGGAGGPAGARESKL